jgi:6-pyruvoyltetrahydropterin/6-carboxytetrahydropterin synthase
MYFVTKTFLFDASHLLPAHDGKCKNLHGHTWKVEITVKADAPFEDGPKTGMVMDFGDIKAAWLNFCEPFLDHKHLNESLPNLYPTSENLAEWIYRRLVTQTFGIDSVTVWETPTSSAMYRP